MRRDFRKKDNNDKIIMYSIIGIGVLVVLLVALLMYAGSLDTEMNSKNLSIGEIDNISDSKNDTEITSSSIGKTVKDGESDAEKEKLDKSKEKTDEVKSSVNNTENNGKQSSLQREAENKNSNIVSTQANLETSAKSSSETKEIKKQTEENNKKKITFQMPIEGDIIREFAKDSLVFSETLQEWVTHTGIDIKAEKTAVVQSAEDGTVKSIKNDPRYGLTIVIEHEDGFETVYANLLSSEFVSEGEKVIKGQSIGTIGNTAVFESADEPHLHFEILKDSISVDPKIYM